MRAQALGREEPGRSPLQDSHLGNPWTGSLGPTADGVQYVNAAQQWSEHTILQSHLCYLPSQSLHSKIIGTDKDVAQFLYPFICQWTLEYPTY